MVLPLLVIPELENGESRDYQQAELTFVSETPLASELKNDPILGWGLFYYADFYLFNSVATNPDSSLRAESCRNRSAKNNRHHRPKAQKRCKWHATRTCHTARQQKEKCDNRG